MEIVMQRLRSNRTPALLGTLCVFAFLPWAGSGCGQQTMSPADVAIRVDGVFRSGRLANRVPCTRQQRHYHARRLPSSRSGNSQRARVSSVVFDLIDTEGRRQSADYVFLKDPTAESR
jgi:hypothetical protein